jgi:hypothetical protein
MDTRPTLCCDLAVENQREIQEEGFPCRVLPWIEKAFAEHKKRMRIMQHEPWHPLDHLRVNRRMPK